MLQAVQTLIVCIACFISRSGCVCSFFGAAVDSNIILVTCIIHGCVKHNSTLEVFGCAHMEVAVVECNILVGIKSFLINVNILVGAVEVAVCECHIGRPVYLSVVFVRSSLNECAVNERRILCIQNLHAGDGAVLVGQLAGMLEALVSFVGERNSHALKAYRGCFVNFALHINDSVLCADNGNILAGELGKRISAVLVEFNSNLRGRIAVCIGRVCQCSIQFFLRGSLCISYFRILSVLIVLIVETVGLIGVLRSSHTDTEFDGRRGFVRHMIGFVAHIGRHPNNEGHNFCIT